MKITILKERNYPAVLKLQKAFEVVKKGKICVAIGGDGTFIRAARSFDGPILAIRTNEKGSIGYYADITTEQIDYAIRKLKSGSYTVEKLASKIEIIYKGKHHYAINEASLNNFLREVSFRIYEIRNGKKYEIYPYVMSGDGILITSVVGSTAYNKSAGGPIILSPDVFCLTFLNVDGPYRNPIVVDSKKEIEIEVVKYDGMLRYDGIEIARLRPGESFRVRLSKKQLDIVRLGDVREEFGEKLGRIIRSRMER